MLALVMDFIKGPLRPHPAIAAGDNLREFRGHSGGGTPGPIPNPEVKPSSADGTARETVWESRSPPGVNREGPSRKRGAFFFDFGPRTSCWVGDKMVSRTRIASYACVSSPVK